MRRIHNANDISALLVGFAVAKISDIKMESDALSGAAISITFANVNHVAVDMTIGNNGAMYIGEPYAINDDLSIMRSTDMRD